MAKFMNKIQFMLKECVHDNDIFTTGLLGAALIILAMLIGFAVV